jgi:hypothetical protein
MREGVGLLGGVANCAPAMAMRDERDVQNVALS